MKEREKRELVKWVIIGLAVLLLIFIVYKVFTGRVVDVDTSCVDTDNGLDWTVKGQVSGVSYYGENYNYKDNCQTQTENLTSGAVGSEFLSEAFCYASPDENGPKIFYSATRINCLYGCNDGACISTTKSIILNDSIRSTTFNIMEVSHTAELITTSSNTATIKVDGVSKTVTKGNNSAFEGDINVYLKDVIHPAYAGDLRQVELFVSSLAGFCTDSDGGQNYYVKGKTISTYDGGVDVCDSADKERKRVIEISCESSVNKRITLTHYTCPNGCSDGACLNVTSTIPSETTPEVTIPPKSETLTTTPSEEATPPTVNENNEIVCTGCLFVKSCLPYGYRTSLSYCDIDNTLVKQISEGSCTNNFECTSNVCVEGQCTTPGLFTQFLNWFKALFGAK